MGRGKAFEEVLGLLLSYGESKKFESDWNKLATEAQKYADRGYKFGIDFEGNLVALRDAGTYPEAGGLGQGPPPDGITFKTPIDDYKPPAAWRNFDASQWLDDDSIIREWDDYKPPW